MKFRIYIFVFLLFILAGCSSGVRSLQRKSTAKIPSEFILVRISATDCINCLIAYHQVLRTISAKNLDSNTVLLVGNLPLNQQEEFFNAILGDKTTGKNIINNDTLYRQLGKTPSSSVSIYKNNKKVFEMPFAEYNDMDFRHEMSSIFKLKNSTPIQLKGDSTGYLQKHYADEDYVLFQDKIYSFSNQFGKIYSFSLPNGKAGDSIKLSQLTDQLDFLKTINMAVSDDTGSIRLTHELIKSGKNYLTENPTYPRYTLTNVSVCDSFLCVSLYITYFMKTDDPKSYGVNKRPVLLLLDKDFKIRRKIFFSRSNMGEYWTFDYHSLYYDYISNVCWKRIFLDADDKNEKLYTLGRFSDKDDDGIFDLDSMLVEIPELFRKKGLNYNFLSSGFLATPDTLLYYFQMMPEIHSLDSNVTTTFPQINMSILSADYKNMKFVTPYRALDLCWRTTQKSCMLVFSTDKIYNSIYEWRDSPTVFREYKLPDGRISKSFLVGDSVLCIWGEGMKRKIEYFALPN
jgi:hypothetical protein